MNRSHLPVVIIGAGPVGLAGASRVLDVGMEPVVIERGSQIGATVAEWAHVRMFSPWRYVTDESARARLERAGWSTPDPEGYPTGRELLNDYLLPLGAHPDIAPHIRLDTRCVAVTRDGLDKMRSDDRDARPFLAHVTGREGAMETIAARAVIDASGTWNQPNPLGAHGIPAPGEPDIADRVAWRAPDVRGAEREVYTARRVLVVGSGHTAFNALVDLAALAEVSPETRITWAIRRSERELPRIFGGGRDDALPERGRLGTMVNRLVQAGQLRLEPRAAIHGFTRTDNGVMVHLPDRDLGPFDRIVAATGYRPDLSMLRELQMALDPICESPIALAPLIDPNLHSCGTVPPHGARELAHPERDFYIVGMKSYGRAPTFLLLTGYEQVRSVVAAIAGDWASANDVHLVLPETGVCSGPADEGVAEVGGCCESSGESNVITLSSLAGPRVHMS